MLLIPDMTLTFIKKAFYPSPADHIMKYYKDGEVDSDNINN